ARLPRSSSSLSLHDALPIYLKNLPPQTSGKTSPDALLHELRASMRLAFDGRPAEGVRVEVADVSVGQLRLTRLRVTGRTPPSVSRFTFANDAVTGFFVLRLKNEGGAAVTQWVEGGKTSPPFPLGREVVPPSRLEVVRLYL